MEGRGAKLLGVSERQTNSCKSWYFGFSVENNYDTAFLLPQKMILIFIVTSLKDTYLASIKFIEFGL